MINLYAEVIAALFYEDYGYNAPSLEESEYTVESAEASASEASAGQKRPREE